MAYTPSKPALLLAALVLSACGQAPIALEPQAVTEIIVISGGGGIYISGLDGNSVVRHLS